MTAVRRALRKAARQDEAAAEDGAWRCPVCGATNAADEGGCRVCRTGQPARDEGELREEDGFLRAPLWRVLPFSLLLLLGGLLAAAHAPETIGWASSVASRGWVETVRVNRSDQLRQAIHDVRGLADALDQALATGAPAPADWAERLSRTRVRWEIYGDSERFPALAEPETEVAAVLGELASLRFQLAGGLAPAEGRATLNRLVKRLERAEEMLPDVH